VLESIRAKLDIVSGLHHILGEEPEFTQAAKRAGVRIFDVRVPPKNLEVAHDKLRALKQQRVALVGSDCSVTFARSAGRQCRSPSTDTLKSAR